VKKLALPALTVLGLSASAANAATYTIDYQQSNNPFTSDGLYSAVTIDSEIYDGTFNAGGFNLTNDVLGEFIAFCIEVTQALRNGEEYEIVEKPFTEAVRDNVESLFNTSYEKVVDDITSAHTNGGSVLATAQGFLDGLNDKPTSLFEIDFLMSAASQDVVTARRLDDLTPVPLPASGLLLLSAAGLIVVQRKKS
jgi:hypothetical protein